MSDDGEQSTTTRRGILAGVGATVLYALGFFSGTASADDGSASGQIATSAEPAKHIYTEQVVYHPRTSDPTTPDDGTEWYRSNV